MAVKAKFNKYTLKFKQAGGTSRGVLYQKETYFLRISGNSNIGIGECPLFKGLSIDDVPGYENKLQWLCDNIDLDQDYLMEKLVRFPSIQFGLEQALLSLKSKNILELFPSKFTNSKDKIAINGLIWMGDKEFMKKQIHEKLLKGFTTIKLKIGAIDFETELALIKSIRNEYGVNEIELRVDANGAFETKNALEKLNRLSEFELHSIEQPIQTGQWEEMAKLCLKSPVAIALDEELIGIYDGPMKERMIQMINPQYIILKPGLIGGFEGSNSWIGLAEKNKIKWWITSALESNIGLNAIAQFTYNLKTTIPQGLGTGDLFDNNIDSPLEVQNGCIYYLKDKPWGDFRSLFY